MRLQDVEQFIDENSDDCDPGTPATPEMIQRAEAILGVTFPDDYRQFLQRWGTLSIGPIEFYGISGRMPENAQIPNTVWYTLAKREEVGLPNNLVILVNNDGVEYHCIDTTHQARSRVVVFDLRKRAVGHVKADSLFDYIINESANAF